MENCRTTPGSPWQGRLTGGLLSLVALLPLLAFAREANTTLRLPPEPPLSGYGLVDALPGVRFEQLVAIKHPPGETNRLFVLQRGGRIMVVTNLAAPNSSIFLDLTPSTVSWGVEPGLLGLAFHPGYATNGFFYVYRSLLDFSASGSGLHFRISRFSTSATNANVALPESELTLLSQLDDSEEHNAGELIFGPDGYLYASLGDEGAQVWQLGLDHRPIDQDFFGAILRLDVDRRPGNLTPNPHPASTTNYAIPADNPFVGITEYEGQPVDPAKVRTEFYAIGFRNPWRMGFDRVTGTLYTGDVGEDKWEEVNIVQPGRNYGWPMQEGPDWYGHYVESPPTNAVLEPPLWAYPHGNGTNDGRAVVGGHVYRGANIPDLFGSYIFGDNFLGNIWALRHSGTNVTSVRRLTANLGLSCFGEDPRDEAVLVGNFNDGRVRRLVYVSPATVTNPIPATLAETGAFTNLATLTPHAGIVPYDINVPFWSDNARKRRWFSVPNTNATIGFRADEPWVFPRGTVWIKHFDLELTNGVPASAVRLETRFLVQGSNGVYGVTYRWNSATNATLVPDEGATENFVIQKADGVLIQPWRYPARSECAWCHSPEGGSALGFNTGQLNNSLVAPTGPTNRLVQWSQEGYFSPPITNAQLLRTLAAPTNEAVPIQYRARSYLSANCSQCHTPTTDNFAYLGWTWDARIQTPTAQAGFDWITSWGQRIVPGDPDASAIPYRMGWAGRYRMPPIATAVLDQQGLALIRDYIQTLPTAPWTNDSIGSVVMEGGAAVSNGVYTIGSSARSDALAAEAVHYLHQPVQENLLLLARGTSQSATGNMARAGLMLRASPDANSPMVWLATRPGGQVSFRWRATTNAAAQETTWAGGSAAPWLRLRREGDLVQGAFSPDGVNWTSAGSASVPLASPFRAGLAVSAAETNQFNNAVFDNLELTQIRLAAPVSNQTWSIGEQLSMEAEVQTYSGVISRVDFRSDGVTLGSAYAAPWAFVWQAQSVGRHLITAVAVDSLGSEVASTPLAVDIVLPLTRAAFVGTNGSRGGNWLGSVGRAGYAIPRNGASLPDYCHLEITADISILWSSNTTSPAALQSVNGTGRVASAWQAAGNLSLNLALNDGQAHRVSLYFLDWNTTNRQVLSVVVRDPVSGSALDERELAGFAAGRYLTWDIRGAARFEVTAQTGWPAVVSGLFLDSVTNAPPSVTLLWPTNGASIPFSESLTVRAEASDPEGQLAQVEFFVDGSSIGAANSPPFEATWSRALAGTHTFTAVATDALGEVGQADPVAVEIQHAPAGAVFLGVDWQSRGDWLGAYGGEAYLIPSHATQVPPYLQVTPETNLLQFVFVSDTDDPRALTRLDYGQRIASCFVATPGFTFDLDLQDTAWHRLGLYFCDFSEGHRACRVELLDPEQGQAVLASQEMREFADGAYLVFGVRGHLTLRLSRLGGVNTLLTALFLDTYPVTFEQWRKWTFSPAQLAEAGVSAGTADPDSDGLSNFEEFALGTSPLEPTPAAARPSAWIEAGRLYYRFSRRLSAGVGIVTPEISDDLTNWRSGAEALEIVSESVTDDVAHVVVRSWAPVAATAQQFLRLRIQP